MRARRFVPLMAAVFLLVPAMPASAHIDDFAVTGFAISSEGDPPQNTADAVFGRITCTAGERFLVTAKWTDESYVGKGRTKGTCTGEQQNWTVAITDESGGIEGCFGRVSAKAHTKIDGVPHDEERHTLHGC